MTKLKVTLATIVAIIMLNLPAFAQVVEYDTPYEAKWSQTPPKTVKECRVLGVFPCHEGWDYEEPEGSGTLSQSRPEPQPEPETCK